MALFTYITNAANQSIQLTDDFSRPRKLQQEDEFFTVLMRLRLGLLNTDVADRFGVSGATMTGIFIKWICILNQSCMHGLELYIKQFMHSPSIAKALCRKNNFYFIQINKHCINLLGR